MKAEEVVMLMEASKTEKEWNDNCDKVKKCFGGYPDFWYQVIVASGIASRKGIYFAYGVQKMNKALIFLNGLLQYDKTMTVAQAAHYLKGLR